jgi:hypothetical protein
MQYLAVSLYQIPDRSWSCTSYWWSSIFFFFNLTLHSATNGRSASIEQPLQILFASCLIAQGVVFITVAQACTHGRESSLVRISSFFFAAAFLSMKNDHFLI